MSCKNCGGDMLGDGHSVVYHCEYTDPECTEADADPVYCTILTD